jgi:hypothetical protein
VSTGRRDDAILTQLVMLRLTRHWRRDPMIHGYLVTAVCEQGAMESVNLALQAGSVSPSVRQALNSELALHDTMDGYSWALRSERAFSLTSVREFPHTAFWVTQGITNDLMVQILDLYDQYLEKGSRPFAKVATKKSRAVNRPPSIFDNPWAALVTNLEPGLAALRDPAERTRALSRSLRILNAIQTRVSSSGDQVKLSDLGLPDQVTIDPYNDKPLQMKKQPAGWMIYSVGSNLVDDGGILDYKHDVGVGPITADAP